MTQGSPPAAVVPLQTELCYFNPDETKKGFEAVVPLQTELCYFSCRLLPLSTAAVVPLQTELCYFRSLRIRATS